MIKTPQIVEIQMLEELVESHHAYLRHFAMVHEKEAKRVQSAGEVESWKSIKYAKQKTIYRECSEYCAAEVNRSLAEIWQKRANNLYTKGDFDGLKQLRSQIENKSFPPVRYAALLQERYAQLQKEISELRENTRRVKVSMLRDKKMQNSRSV